ncbi:hypothetical protein DYST_02186 [Dyella terrae]|nr:hypothetical protein DYST_02186 [Dyella terrae]
MASMEDHYAVCMPCRLRNEARKAEARANPPTPHPEPAPPPSSIYDPNLYYAQLQLVREGDGGPVPNLPYEAILSDGTRECGATDANGFTAIICTARPLAVQRVTLTSPAQARTLPCCDAPLDSTDGERIYLDAGSNVFAYTAKTTTEPAVTRLPVPKGRARALTAGERSHRANSVRRWCRLLRSKDSQSWNVAFFGVSRQRYSSNAKRRNVHAFQNLSGRLLTGHRRR